MNSPLRAGRFRLNVSPVFVVGFVVALAVICAAGLVTLIARTLP